MPLKEERAVFPPQGGSAEANEDHKGPKEIGKSRIHSHYRAPLLDYDILIPHFTPY